MIFIPVAAPSNSRLLCFIMFRWQVLLILCSAPLLTSALTQGEIAALSSILKTWPALSSAEPPWVESNLSQACSRVALFGVICSHGEDPHVTSLYFNHITLQNAMPAAIGDLPYLESLTITDTLLTGTEINPAIFKSGCLKKVTIATNYLVGTIPSTLLANTNLEQLSIGESGIRGVLPPGLGNLRSLTELSLIGQFMNPVPNFLQNLSNLTSLSIGCPSGAHQRVPDWIDKLENLRVLMILRGFNGELPAALFRLPSLAILEFRYNSLSGTIPEAIGNLSTLTELSIFSTSLQGTLPASIGRLSKLTQLTISNSYITGPLPSDFMNLQLTMFTFSYARGRGLGQLPEDFGRLSKLQQLNLKSSGLVGTIPASFWAPQLSIVDMSQNDLVGDLPKFLPQTMHQHWPLQFIVSENKLSGGLENMATLPDFYSWIDFDLSNNQFSGTLPPALFFSDRSKISVSLDLRNNKLTGTIPTMALWNIEELDLSYNNLTGDVPWRIKPDDPDVLSRKAMTTRIEGERKEALLKRSRSAPMGILSMQVFLNIKLSHNALTGTVPVELYRPGLNLLDLSHNQLNGSLERWGSLSLEAGSKDLPHWIDFSFNQLSGPLPDLSKLAVSTLGLSHNQISGALPMFNDTITHLDISHNKLEGSLIQYPFPTTSKLQTLDLSYNQLTGQLPPQIVSGSIAFLYLSHNNFFGSVPVPVSFQENGTAATASISTIDLSFNSLSIADTTVSFDRLTSLQLNNNAFEGRISLKMPQLSSLDISNNNFNFPIIDLTNYPKLVMISASNNSLTGLLENLLLPNLEFADLSSNSLGRGYEPSSGSSQLAELSNMFHRRLRVLSISNNTYLPPISTFDPAIGPWRSQQVQPSENFPIFVNCYSMTFVPGSKGLEFRFDENFFSYTQCDCALGYYGVPPDRCFKCPPNAECKGRNLKLHDNFFLFGNLQVVEGYSNLSSANLSDSAHPSILQTEYCISSISHENSNCDSITITIEVDDTPLSIIERLTTWNKDQCSQGSEGRLCSRCICEHPYGKRSSSHESYLGALSSEKDASEPSCYYKRGIQCAKCAKIFKPSQSISIILGVLFVALLVTTIIMFLVLRSKRRQKDEHWEKLSFVTRAWYRMTEASNFGFITIAVLFVQILVELTHWDDYILKEWAELANGNSEGIGIICLLPSLLNKPFEALLLRLMIPVIIGVLFALSIGLAELLYRLIDFYQHRQLRNFNLVSDASDSESSVSMLKEFASSTRVEKVHYPTSALLLSTTISVLKFFYFGIALASTEFFFSDTQVSTHLKYVQAHPWMLYSDAEPMRRLSLSWVVVVVAGLPVLFIICAWNFRHQIRSPTASAYLGSIFTRFKQKWYWWEIVNVLKKLAIALLLRGVPSSNALQSAFIILSIGFPLLMQTTCKPWKRNMENTMDPIGGILLISSLFASNTQHFSGHKIVLYLALTLDLIYVIALIALILYEAVVRKTDYEIIWEARFAAVPTETSPSLTQNVTEKFIHTPLMRSPFTIEDQITVLDTMDEN